MGVYSDKWKGKKLPFGIVKEELDNGGTGFRYEEYLTCNTTGEFIYFGDFVEGYTEANRYYEGQVSEVGGGTLGIWHEDDPIEINPENGGDYIKTIVLVERAEEIDKENLHPKNELFVSGDWKSGEFNLNGNIVDKELIGLFKKVCKN